MHPRPLLLPSAEWVVEAWSSIIGGFGGGNSGGGGGSMGLQVVLESWGKYIMEGRTWWWWWWRYGVWLRIKDGVVQGEPGGITVTVRECNERVWVVTVCGMGLLYGRLNIMQDWRIQALTIIPGFSIIKKPTELKTTTAFLPSCFNRGSYCQNRLIR